MNDPDNDDFEIGAVALAGDPAVPSQVLALVLHRLGPFAFDMREFDSIGGLGLIISREPGTTNCVAMLIPIQEALRRAGVPEKKDMN